MATPSTTQTDLGTIKALDGASVHRIASGQVVVDLQTAVKELVENSLDAGATSVEVRFKDHGLNAVEVIDNGSGIAPEDYDAIALKHHTSKLFSFSDLTQLHTFGFRGEALSSLCALAERISVATATASVAPLGTILEFDRSGRVNDRQGKVPRQRGTTVTVTGLFKPLPVRRKELERNAKREFGKALALLSAYALVPCAQENKGVRLSVTHLPNGGKKTVQIRTDGTPSTRASVSALWGPKMLEHLVDLDLHFTVEVERAVLRRQGIADKDGHDNAVHVRGLVSKFAVGCGRTGTDRQFFFINGRPCSPAKVQKAFNEVYRTFNATQAPFIVADFVLPKDSCDVNVSPDKRTILLHSENNLVQALKAALESTFAPSRATYDLNPSQSAHTRGTQAPAPAQAAKSAPAPLFLHDDDEENSERAEKSMDVDTSLDVDDEDQGSFGEPSLLLRTSSDVHAGAGEGERADHPSEDATVDLHADEPPAIGSPAPSSKPVSSGFALLADQTHRSDEPAVDVERAPDIPADVEMQDSVPDGRPPSPTVAQMQIAPAAVSADDDDDVRIRKIASPASARPSPPRRAEPQRPAPSRARDSGDAARGVQTVLSTSGAAWSLQRRADADGCERASKRRRVDGGARAGRDAQQDLRARLRGFARTGSQVVDVAEDEEPERDELEEGGALRSGTGPSADEEAEDGSELSYGAEDVRAQDTDVDTEHPPRATRRSRTSPGSSTLDEDSDDATPDVSTLSSTAPERVARPEVIRTADGEETSLRFDLSRISATWGRLQKHVSAVSASSVAVNKSSLIKDAGIANAEDDGKAAEALSRVIDKTDFATMEVVGQFNLGFIIVRRRKRPARDAPAEGEVEDEVVLMDDLFIVDQHAADEKYNFETLQQTTKIDSQKLFRAQPLELTAADALLATENIDVLRQNGFEVDVDEDAAPGEGHRLKLLAQPISKSTVFDMKDLEELLNLMQDRPVGQMVRCSKARAMFAMRACRKSIMVGKALTRQQMTSVVRHMGTMDQPWHCPHGRPTARHLSDLAGMQRNLRDGGRTIDWRGFGCS